MNTKILENLGKKIKYYRKEANLTQEQLAEKVGVHQTYIGKLETGKINASTKQLFIISKALKVDMKDLFDFE